MSKSRRQFLNSTVVLMGAAAACTKKPEAGAPVAADSPAGMPPAFGTAPAVGPVVNSNTFAEAEKLVQFTMTQAEREQASGNWRSAIAPLYEMRTGPRKATIESTVAPWSRVDPTAVGGKAGPDRDKFVRSKSESRALPANDDDIAFAPLTQLSRWIEERKLTSDRLTQIYLDRIERYNPKLRCVITLTRDLALAQAKACRRRNRGGKISRTTAWNSVGREGSARHGGDRDDVWRRTVQGSSAEGRCGSRETIARRGRGADREVEPGRAGAERYLVWRADDESVAAGRRRLGIERGTGSSDGCGTGRILDRQRDWRKYREPVDALRRDGIAANVRPRAANGRDDAVLVAG